MILRPYEYMVLLHPAVNGKLIDALKEASKIVVDKQSCMSASAKAVEMRAIREIPPEFIDDFDRIEIIVQPFGR